MCVLRSVVSAAQETNVQLVIRYYTVSQTNDTGVAHYNFDADQPILIILTEMLPREYAIKW